MSTFMVFGIPVCPTFLKSHEELLLECNYSSDHINIISPFYYELLNMVQQIQENFDPNNEYKYVIWNNKEILIGGKNLLTGLP